jgi:homoserine kinase
MPDSITVRVPATSANLGPGFDCLGLALDLTAGVTVSLAAAPADEHPMVLAALRAAYRAAGQREPDDEQLLALGAELEGHADNIAPALFGGLQVVAREGEGWHHLRVPLAAGLKVVLFVPDFAMPTKESRQRLPKRLSREDAVFNAGRVALLVAALAQGRWDLLDAATQDRLHQPVRAEIFPAMHDIFAAAMEAGAHAAYLSGAGSTIAALVTEGEERVARLMQQAAVARGYSGRSLISAPTEQGAHAVEA